MFFTFPETFPGAPAEDSLAPLVGYSAARELHYATHGQQDAWDQIRALADALNNDDEALFVPLAASAIYQSAVMMRFRGSHAMHAPASAAYHLADEWEKEKGHNEECRRRGYGPYARAHDRAMRDAGHEPAHRSGLRCYCKEA